MRDDFAVLIPAWNERENIAPLYAAIAETFRRHGLAGEVVLCDDGSTDGTYEAAVEASRALGPAARVVRHGRNMGKTESMLSAVRGVTKRYAVMLDADLQYAPEEIPRFLEELDRGVDVVTARKVGQYDKQQVSSAYNWLSKRLFHAPVRDLNSMKACRTVLLEEIPLRHDWHRFFVVLAHLRGYRVTEIDVTLHPRHAGVPKYQSRRRILTGFGDLIVVWFTSRVSEKPMHFFGKLALWMFGLGSTLGIVTLALRLMRVAPPPIGYRPIVGLVGVLMLAGIVLFAVGLVAELIAILNAEVSALRAQVRALKK